MNELLNELQTFLRALHTCSLTDDEHKAIDSKIKKINNFIENATDEYPELTSHIVVEDPRYPLLCINGKFNYGVWIDPTNGEIEQIRRCICGGNESECFCDLKK